MSGLYPFGWVFIPRMKDALTIEVDHKPIVLCKDCRQWDEEGSVMGRGWCGWHMKSTGPCFFCADGEKEEGDDPEVEMSKTISPEETHCEPQKEEQAP